MRNRRNDFISQNRDFNMRIMDKDDIPIDPGTGTVDFNKIKVGIKNLDDAVVDSPLKKVNKNFADKDFILKALDRADVFTLKEISKFYYRTSGIYKRLCKYMAFLYRYDWYIVPYISGGDTYPAEEKKEDINAKQVNKILDSFFKVLWYLDNFKAKQMFKHIALKVVVEGCYYGYIIHNATGPTIQELPSEYCRSRYKKNNRHVIEFNMKYFDDLYKDPEYRKRILKLFPDDFRKGYNLYKNGKTIPFELKSRNVSSKESLDEFRKKYAKKIGEKYIVHIKKLSYGDNLTFLPYYMLFALK